MLRTTFIKQLRHVATTVILGATMSATGAAHAAWPEKQINMVVSYGAGGSVDYLARLIAPVLAERLGQPIVVENVGGAAGSIGAARVARSHPDGYTLMLGSGSEVAVAWAVNPSLKYNGITGLTPIALIGTSPMALVGNAEVPARTLDELLVYAKANPGKLSLATSGIGTPQHLLLEYINRRSGSDVVHIPYRSASSILTDVLGGRVDLTILTLTNVLPYLESGKLQGYAVTGAQPSAVSPKLLPLANNTTLKGADFSLWFGLLAPAGLPDDITQRLNKEIAAVLQEPAIRENLAKQGIDIQSTTPGQFADFVKADSDKYQRIIKEAGITVN